MNITVTVENTKRIVVTVDNPSITAVFETYDEAAKFIQALITHIKSF